MTSWLVEGDGQVRFGRLFFAQCHLPVNLSGNFTQVFPGRFEFSLGPCLRQIAPGGVVTLMAYSAGKAMSPGLHFMTALPSIPPAGCCIPLPWVRPVRQESDQSHRSTRQVRRLRH